MPKQVMKFDEGWLTDRRFCSWIKKSKVSDEAYCTLSKNSFSVAIGGEYQVLQHQRSQKHAKVKQAGKSQPKFEATAGSVQVNCSDTKQMLSSEEQIVHAEIPLVLRSVQHNHSFCSSDDLVPVPVTVVLLSPVLTTSKFQAESITNVWKSYICC
jgi:hypothetical protein